MPADRIRKLYTFTLDDDLKDGLEKIRHRDGVPASETVRRALRAYLQKQGVLPKGGPAAKPRVKRRQAG